MYTEVLARPQDTNITVVRLNLKVLTVIASLLGQSLTAPVNDDCNDVKFHGHHKHKRDVVYDYAYVTVTVDGDGELIEQETTSTSAPTTSSSTSSTSTSEEATTTSESDGESDSEQTSSSDVPTGNLKSYQKPTEEFQDGVISCDEFPSEAEGIIPLFHLGFGGWSGIYHEDTSTGGKCTDGSYCSYACQPGMAKTQWPSKQPENGVSVGGLQCKNGKLYRTNKDAKTLCEWGEDKAYVESKLDKTVAICQTDYPGTENMVIPTILFGNDKSPITTVNQKTYYKWQGKSTSCQYYVNDAGVDWTTGCSWGDFGTTYGNWAPLNFGASYADGIAYLSLIPNPNNKDALNYNVKIVADGDGSVVSGDCKYENGKYNGGGSDGCTVGVTSGKAKFVLYN